ncbi:C4-dicarboxylate transporter/malic acid transport protein, partial [Xylona heveae TC161]
VSILERMRHMTWAWYTTTMSAGGIALLLRQTPHQFRGLETIGKIVFIFDLVLFCGISGGMCLRFWLVPKALKQSFQHPTESLFFGCFWLSIATIISDIQLYGVPACGPWLIVAQRVLFWIYVACTALVGIFQYWYLFTATHITLQSFAPSWILPIFPVMLSGTIASVISSSQPREHAIPIIVAGTTFQGLGFLVSMLMYANYFGRLLTAGLPEPATRPGMFISVGPPSFTAIALIGMANGALQRFPEHYIGEVKAVPTAEVLVVVAVFASIFLWALSFWFFCTSLVSVLVCVPRLSFHLTWWSMVFPNTGFILATINIGRQLHSEGVLWVTSVFTVIQVAVWLFVGVCHIRAVWLGLVLWPGKDEDKEE